MNRMMADTRVNSLVCFVCCLESFIITIRHYILQRWKRLLKQLLRTIDTFFNHKKSAVTTATVLNLIERGEKVVGKVGKPSYLMFCYVALNILKYGVILYTQDWYHKRKTPFVFQPDCISPKEIMNTSLVSYGYMDMQGPR